MPATAIAAEPVIRLGFFLGIFLTMALWEALAPKRPQAIGRLRRWPNNLGLVVIDTLIVRLLFPLAGVGMAFLATSRGWGLFNILPLPAWLPIPAAVLLLEDERELGVGRRERVGRGRSTACLPVSRCRRRPPQARPCCRRSARSR